MTFLETLGGGLALAMIGGLFTFAYRFPERYQFTTTLYQAVTLAAAGIWLFACGFGSAALAAGYLAILASDPKAALNSLIDWSVVSIFGTFLLFVYVAFLPAFVRLFHSQDVE